MVSPLEQHDFVRRKRPGKDGPGWSATTGRCRNEQSGELLYVFSGNASPFEPERAYSKFATYTLLDHNGDFKAAAKDLAEQGYGEQRQASAKRQGKNKSPAVLVSRWAGRSTWRAHRSELNLSGPSAWCPERPCRNPIR